MNTNELAKSLGNELALSLPDEISRDELRSRLSEYFNHLVRNEFEKLVAYLYRIDVSEQKLKQLLKEHPGEDAGNIIADLVMERQVQKIKTRRQFSGRDQNMNDEEKW